MGLLCGENCTILTTTVFAWITRVTDRRTDRQTDRRTDGRNCDSICALSIYAVARNKTTCVLLSVCLSVCLSVRTPTVAIFVRFWWNFAQKLGARKVRMLSLGSKYLFRSSMSCCRPFWLCLTLLPCHHAEMQPPTVEMITAIRITVAN